MAVDAPILVTGAAGRVGGVGRDVGIASEYSDALGRTIRYVEEPFEPWLANDLDTRQLPKHVFEHLRTLARLHAKNRYDRLTHDVLAVTGRPATSVRDYVAKHPELFG
jgi:NAD(P)H dehydrogenase (quinone)